jgi:hypothetical protein
LSEPDGSLDNGTEVSQTTVGGRGPTKVEQSLNGALDPCNLLKEQVQAICSERGWVRCPHGGLEEQFDPSEWVADFVRDACGELPDSR